MSHNLKVRGLNPNLQFPASSETPSAIAQILSASQVDAAVISKISRTVETTYFQLGEEILVTSPEVSENIVSDFYFVCQGQVRLLCQGDRHSRPVTAMLLDAENGFGADHLVCSTPLPYRAIAVGTVQVARLAADELAPLLQKFPLLRSHLQQAALHRERMIFFKTSTLLESCSSRQLEQFIPLLTEQQIAADAPLTEATPGDTGHFWLRQGTILRAEEDTPSSSSEHPPAMSWGYPEATPLNWIAQTDLRVYVLSSEQWQAANAIIPTLNTSAINAGAEVSQPVSKSPGKGSVARSPQLHHYLHKQKVPSKADAATPC